jgi:hypothetical protein
VEAQVHFQVTLCEVLGGKVAQSKFFFEFNFHMLITIPPLLHTHPSLPLEVCDNPEQAAHYHTLSL